MPLHPHEVWHGLSPQLPAQILDELTAIFQEVSYEYLRTDHAPPSAAHSHQLSSAVEPPSGAEQPRESAAAGRAARARRGVGLARAEESEVLDGDQGLSGTAVPHREGFTDLLPRVTLGEVGISLASELQRLSRPCSAWSPLRHLCGDRHGLLADRAGVYDPGTPTGRWLRGLKGPLAAMELYTLRARMTAGLLNTAPRGDRALSLPVGLVRDDEGTVRKEPNREVPQRLELVFSTCLQRRSASKVLQCFNAPPCCSRGATASAIWGGSPRRSRLSLRSLRSLPTRARACTAAPARCAQEPGPGQPPRKSCPAQRGGCGSMTNTRPT